MKSIIYILVIFTLIACNAYKGVDVEGLQKGMSQVEVSKSVGKKLDKVSMSEDSDGTVKEVFQVQKRIVRGGIARQERYNFYFINNELVKYEKDSEKFSF